MTRQSFAQIVDGGAGVGEFVTFSASELDIITDALTLAASHYRLWAEHTPRDQDFREQFYKQASECGELQLKIEAAR